MLAISNDRVNSRLGLVIAKKHVPLAVQRNRLKRLIRNAFRLNSNLLTSLDLVVLARKDADRLDNKQLTEALLTLWRDLGNKQEQRTTKLGSNHDR